MHWNIAATRGLPTRGSTMRTATPSASTGAPTSAPPSLAGLSPQQQVHWNLWPAELYEHALRRGEGMLADGGAFCAVTSPHTGRSPKDKFVVREPESEPAVWWGNVNHPIAPEHFDRLHADVVRHLNGQDLYVRDVFAGADPVYRTAVRFVSPNAWHTLFVYNMFLRPLESDLAAFAPTWQVLHAPEMAADPATHGTRTGAFIVIHLARRTILIGGTRYAGELKKSIFTILNFVLPTRGVLPMHCSANVGEAGDVALFFGLSGTGKTTLSADPERGLIGDDEHGWSDTGVFNFEGGCYAKVIRLSPDGEPEIYATTRRFGTVLENVVLDPTTRALDLESDAITENTRACYPIHFIPNHVPGGSAGHPSHIVFLTCDAFGVMPPISRLSPAQAMYHFLSGYTAKVAGTERDVTEPKETFSACFGAPFLPRHPGEYATMLGERIARHGVQCWLVNTGWTGGPFGTGQRIRLAHTRTIVRAALAGRLDAVPTAPEPVFGLAVPTEVPGVPPDLLQPRRTWADPAAYDAQAKRLVQLFQNNFQQFADQVPDPVREAGPVLKT
jgi:phosphoenolpyruvate carboxykinase (ATP)